MPLGMALAGEKKKIIRICAKEEVRHHLAGLGFVEGSEITIISILCGNMIVSVKDTRVALDKSMVNAIICN